MNQASAAEPGQNPPVPALMLAFEGSRDQIMNKLILDTVAEPDEGFAPLKVKFSVTADEPVKNPRYTWDFADGSEESHEAKPTHVFKKPGLFKVTVKLRDHGTEKRGEDFVYVDVEEREAPPKAPKAPKVK